MIVVTMMPSPPQSGEYLNVTAAGSPPIFVTVTVDGEEIGSFDCPTTPCGGSVFIPASAQGKVLKIRVEAGSEPNDDSATVKRNVL
ncbi:MAG: hypothetical protein RL885_24315 [Planctomycetota bacterium]